MTFRENEILQDRVCPKCGGQLFYEMSFRDQYSYTSGHYTIDVPVIVCEECEFCEEYETEEIDYD